MYGFQAMNMSFYIMKTPCIQAFEIDHIHLSIRKGDRVSKPNPREAFWIFRSQVTKYPGLTEDLDVFGNSYDIGKMLFSEIFT